MASIDDWAAKAARKIDAEIRLPSLGNRTSRKPSVERIAAIIAVYAEPLLDLLQEARREHSRTYLDEINDHSPCPLSDSDAGELGLERCTCGADAWNARVDAVLDGRRAKR